jgi:DNA repair protein RecN (Recombination protein N)
MLRDLHIRNLAVVEEGAVELGPGFNVLSGETGAGKSIVVDSLALLAGVRASSDLIRTGAEEMTVTGFFEPAGDAWRAVLDEAGIDSGGGELVIRRIVSRSGRSRAFVNDAPVTVTLLSELAPSLLRIHGQREELGLVAPDLQRTWLDRCGGAEAEDLLDRGAAAYGAYRQVADRLERLSGDDRIRRERVDLLRFQLSEIDGAGVVAGEEETLRQDREVLRNSEAIQGALTGSCEALFEGETSAYDQLTAALRLLRDVRTWEPSAGGWVEELEELRIRLGELEGPLRGRSDEVEADPDRLNAIEDRLAILERLFKKHGPTTHEVLARRDEMREELAGLEGDEETLEALQAKAETTLAAYREVADELSAGRRRWSKRLAEGVRKDLADLALAKARFAVRLDTRRRGDSPLSIGGEAVEFSELGYDQVTFTFSPNPGEELRPLAKVASGGELSRLYLAVQLAAPAERVADAAGHAATTLVFDEVDTGIGGAEAARLGAMLQRLARGGQVLAVTHLPQVASYADIHFKVAKDVRRGRTHTTLERLEPSARVEEVARMLAGSEITETSLSHARELIVGAEAR